MEPDLSIIIVSWNTRDLLDRCLQAVWESAAAARLQVIVVDNASDDGSAEMVRQKHPEAVLIQNEANLGFARANNLALPQARGRHLLLLNSDAFLTPPAVDALVGALEASPRLGIAGPQLIYPDGAFQESHGSLPTLGWELLSLFGLNRLWSNAPPSGGAPQGYLRTGWVKGACMALRRELVEQTGLFDEDFFFFSEEIDLCRRAHSAGWEVGFLPQVSVVHAEGGSTRSTAERVLRLYRGKLRYFRKHHSRLAAATLAAAMRLAIYSKALAYSLVRILSLGRVRKDQPWREAARSF
jgi:N-acetylglucosaminyl-diphospho-decaprenol L-rhamnosyltransferase